MLLKNATGITVGTKPASRMMLGSTVVWKPIVVKEWEVVGGPYAFSSIDFKKGQLHFYDSAVRAELLKIFGSYKMSQIYMQSDGATDRVHVSSFEDYSWSIMVLADSQASLESSGFGYGKKITFLRRAV